MPTLLLVHGQVAAGKSTIVERLLPQLPGYVFIDRAYMKHHLKALGQDGAKEAVRAAVYTLLEQCITRDANILAQEIAPEWVRTRLGPLLDEHGYCLVSYRLEASWETTLSRNETRGKNVTPERMREIWANYPARSALDTVIDTEKTSPESIVERILVDIR